MSEMPESPVAGPTYVSVPEIAEALGVVVTKVHQLLRDRTVVGLRRDGVLRVPAEFVQAGQVVKGLPGTITLLTDAGYDDAEIIDWLFAADGSAAGSAMSSLRAGRSREVHRTAQASGF
jgi:hypothetical protein